MAVTEDKIREIKLNTRQQRHTPRIFSRKPTTPPDKLVLSLIQRKSVITPAIMHGIETEQTAITEYMKHQQTHGHSDLICSPCGFHISQTHPSLAASPDETIYAPQRLEQPFWIP